MRRYALHFSGNILEEVEGLAPGEQYTVLYLREGMEEEVGQLFQSETRLLDEQRPLAFLIRSGSRHVEAVASIHEDFEVEEGDDYEATPVEIDPYHSPQITGVLG